MRLLVMGPSGSGTTTLGRALANALPAQHFDSDDFYWYPSDPPYVKPRPVAEREALMETMFLPRSHWVFTGSPLKWGKAVAARLTVIVFITLDPETRIARLTARERRLFGPSIEPGGARHEDFSEFVDWAQSYDDPGSPHTRSRVNHEAWLARQTVPVIRVDTSHPMEHVVGQVLEALP